MSADLGDVLLLVVAALERLGVSYAIGGSFASSAHGIPRSTNDIDIVAELNPKHALPLAKVLQPEFYADEVAIARAIRERRSFNVIHVDSSFKVDVFVAKGEAFDRAQLAGRRLVAIAENLDHQVYVASPEDTILAKLVWYKKGREVSDQQWRDIQGVLRVQAGKLDLDYIKKWAAELGVSELLDRALDAAFS